MKRAYALYVFVASFFSGILYAAYGGINMYVALCVVIILCAVIVTAWNANVMWTVSRGMYVYYSVGAVGVVIVCGFIGGVLRYDMTLDSVASRVLDQGLNHTVTLRGVITEEPESRDNGVRYIITTTAEREQETRVIFTTDPYPRFAYGDEVSVSGVLMKPEVIQDDIGGEFDYPGYLAKDGIFYTLKKARAHFVSRGHASWLTAQLLSLKSHFITAVQNAIPEPESALANGLIIGAKQSFGKTLEDEFRRAGIIHIVVLSGFNITIIAKTLMSLLSFLPSVVGAVLGSVGMILFALLTGATATVIRSVIMGILALSADILRRDYDVTRSVCLAALVMALQNPLIVPFDPSFQLSFLSTLGLILCSEHIKPFLGFVTERFGLHEIAVATIATQLFVMPYLLYQMGQISIVGLIVNFLVLPCIPITMLGAFVTGTVGGVVSAFSFLSPLSLIVQIFGALTYLPLAYELATVHWFASLSFASVTTRHLPLWGMMVWYGVYVYILFKRKNANNTSQK